MYLSILALTIFSSITSGFFGRKIGVTGAHIVRTSCLIASALLSLVAFYEVGLCGSSVSIELSNWIDSESILVTWGFLFDSLTVSILLPVLIVSSLVHLYSISYIREDPHNQRFFSYLSIFTFFILVLVAGNNYFIMFIGWEGKSIALNEYLHIFKISVILTISQKFHTIAKIRSLN
jgi:NADH-ubiquinone oxidoreductase chain 5